MQDSKEDETLNHYLEDNSLAAKDNLRLFPNSFQLLFFFELIALSLGWINCKFYALRLIME